MTKVVQAQINGILIRVPEGTTILEAAKQVQIKIPYSVNTRTCRPKLHAVFVL